ncbi:TPA: hypothetical protein N0F65_001069 [Lagenidium giganteum]|uniref:Uncharacterized protein n=1 Tax=Lagenidium giganteum TaxID=4803 RepID=A0AAV2YM85_9STRA|nr:TPA: hypothetical protein N0F65_001069 [Lagenidium giganteum]
MLSRWAAAPRATHIRRMATPAETRRSSTPPLVCPLDDSGFVWPTLQEICMEQTTHEHDANTSELVRGSDSILRHKGLIWLVPAQAKNLVRRLFIKHIAGRMDIADPKLLGPFWLAFVGSDGSHEHAGCLLMGPAHVWFGT